MGHVCTHIHPWMHKDEVNLARYLNGWVDIPDKIHGLYRELQLESDCRVDKNPGVLERQTATDLSNEQDEYTQHGLRISTGPASRTAPHARIRSAEVHLLHM